MIEDITNIYTIMLDGRIRRFSYIKSINNAFVYKFVSNINDTLTQDMCKIILHIDNTA